ncbi:MAG: hypothetical protein N3C61_01025 [Candidatus Micrarchaeota archaeon]|nr:hypothetical protein [Candidatus Micrarchaeota archaeon]
MLLMLLLVQMSLAQFLFPTQDYYETDYSTIRVHIDGTNCSLYSDRYVLLNIQGYTNRSYYLDVPVSEQNIYLTCVNASTGTLYTQRFSLNITRDFELIPVYYSFNDNSMFISLYPISEYDIKRCFIRDTMYIFFPIYLTVSRPISDESILLTCEYNKSGVLRNQTIQVIEYLHELDERYNIQQQNYCDPVEFSNKSSITYEISFGSCIYYSHIFNNVTRFQARFSYNYDRQQSNHITLNRSQGSVYLDYNPSTVRSTIILENSNATIMVNRRGQNTNLDIIAINSTVKILFINSYTYYKRRVNLDAVDSSISIIESYDPHTTDYSLFNLSQTTFLKSYFASSVLHRWNYTSIPQNLPLYIVNSSLNLSSTIISNRTLLILDSSVVLTDSVMNNTNISFSRTVVNVNNVTANHSSLVLGNSRFSFSRFVSRGNTGIGLIIDSSRGEIFNTSICGYSLDVEVLLSQVNQSNLSCDTSRGIVCSDRCSQDLPNVMIRVYSESDIQNATIIVPFNPKLIQNYTCGNGKVGKNETELYDTYIAGRCNGPTFIFFRTNLSAGYNRFKFYYNMNSSGSLYEVTSSGNSVEIKQHNNILSGENAEIYLWFDPRVTESNNITLRLGNHTLAFVSDGRGMILKHLDSQGLIARFTSPSIIRLLRNDSGLYVYSNGDKLIERFNLNYHPNPSNISIRFSNIDDQNFISMIEYPSNAIFGNIIHQQPLNISVYSPHPQVEGNVYFNISLDSYRDFISSCNYSRYINVYHLDNRLNTQYFCDSATGYLLIAFKTNLTAGDNNFTLVLQDAIENRGPLIYVHYYSNSELTTTRNITVIFKKITPGVNRFPNVEALYFSRFDLYNQYYSIYVSFGNGSIDSYYTGSFANPFINFSTPNYNNMDKSSMEYFYKLYVYKNLSNPLYTLDPGYYEVRVNTEYLAILDPYAMYIDYYNFSDENIHFVRLKFYSYNPNEIAILVQDVSSHDFYVSLPSLNNRIVGNSNPDLRFDISNREFGYVLYSNSQTLNPIHDSQSQVRLENMTIYGTLVISAPTVILRNITLIGKNGMRSYYAVYSQNNLPRNLSCHYGGSNIGFGGSPRQPGHKSPYVNIYWGWKEDYPSSDPNSYNGGWIYINASTVNISNIYLSGWNGGAGGGLLIDAITSDIERVFANGGDVIGCKGAGGGGIVYINSTTAIYRDVYVNGGNANNSNADYVADGGTGVIFISRDNYSIAIFDNNRTNRNIPIQSFLARDVDELIIRNGATVEQFRDRINVGRMILRNHSTYTSPSYPYSTFYIVRVFAINISIDNSSKIDVSSKGIIPIPSRSSCIVEFDSCRNYAGDPSYTELFFDSGGIIELNFRNMELNGSLLANTYNARYMGRISDKAGKIILNGVNITGNGMIDASYKIDCNNNQLRRDAVFNGLIYYNITENDGFAGSKVFFVTSGCVNAHEYYSPGAYFDVKNKRIIIGNDSIGFSNDAKVAISYYRAYDADVIILNTYMKYLDRTKPILSHFFRHIEYPQIFRNVSMINRSVILFNYSNPLILVAVLNNTLQSLRIERSNITAINAFFELSNPNLLLNQSILKSLYTVDGISIYSFNVYNYQIFRLNRSGGPAVIRIPSSQDRGRGGSYGGMAAAQLDVRDFLSWTYTEDDDIIRAVIGNVTSSTYGDYRVPNETGSFGMYLTFLNVVYRTGLAGGMIRILSNRAQILDSQLDVSGSNGGSGGSIYMNVTDAIIWNSILNASGSGIILTTGSFYNPIINYLAGGGGRIAIHFSNLSLRDSNIVAHGSNATASSNLEYIGGAGTVYMLNKSSNRSKLIITNIKPIRSSICGKDQRIQQGYTPITIYDNDPIEELYVANALVYIKSTRPIPRLVLVNSSLSHPQYPFSSTDHLNITVIDLVFSNSVINVTSCGNVMGPGYTGPYSAASYGGLGWGAPSSSIYGNQTDPSALGSGSYTESGGGLARVHIDGNLQGDNLIIDSSGDYQSSGGSILLFVYNRTIPTTLIARGGMDGGGGRVAIYLGFNVTAATLTCDVDGGYNSPQARGTCFTGAYFNLIPISLNPGPLRLNDVVLLTVEMRVFNRSTNSMQIFGNGTVILRDIIMNRQFQVNSTDSRYYLNFTPSAPGEVLYWIEGRYMPNLAARYIPYKVITLGYFINISLNKPIYFPGENAIARISIFKYPEATSYNGPAMIYYRGIYLGNISIVNGYANYTFNVGNTGGYHEFNVVIDSDD